MRRSIFALAFVLVTGNLAAQGPPMGATLPCRRPDDWGRNFFPGAGDAAPE